MLQLDTDVNLTSYENEGFIEIKNIATNNSILDTDDTSKEKEEIVSTNQDSLLTCNDPTNNKVSTPTEGFLFNENYIEEEATSIQDLESDKNCAFEDETIASKDEQVLDLETYLQHLREMFNNKQQYMMEMIEILLLQIPEASQKMEVAINSENWDEVFFQSHRIKSTFKIVGLHKLVNVCMAIEGRTRIIAPEELHLVPDFFKQFQALSKIEVPNLEQAFAYLKDRCEQEKSKLITDNDDSISTFPL